jgi:hypothetical protein
MHDLGRLILLNIQSLDFIIERLFINRQNMPQQKNAYTSANSMMLKVD